MSRLSRFIRKRRVEIIEFPYRWNARFSSRRGVESEAREVPLIVSLTTIPERIHKTPMAIESLLRQTLKPDRLILWLGKSLNHCQFPRRQIERGLEIRFVEDIGPHTKIIYALEEFPGYLIVNCDDDTLYPANWLQELMAAHERQPGCVICHRARQIAVDEKGALVPYMEWKLIKKAALSLSVFPTGVGGILYPPGALHREVFNRAVFQKICPLADDIWLKAMSLLNNTRCHYTAAFSAEFHSIRGTEKKTLWSTNCRGGNNAQLRAVFEHYDLFGRMKEPDFALLPEPAVV